MGTRLCKGSSHLRLQALLPGLPDHLYDGGGKMNKESAKIYRVVG